MPKESSSSDVEDFKPISITPVLSMVLDKIVSGKLTNCLESYGLLLPYQFSYRIGLGKRDNLVTLSHYLQIAL